MKTLIKIKRAYLIVLYAVCILFTSGCCKKCPDVKTEIPPTDQALTYDAESLKSAGPVTDDECELMFKYRDEKYSLNPPTASLNFISTRVRLMDFINYYRTNTTVNINAIRFYPAFTAPDKVFLMLTKGHWDAVSDFHSDADITPLQQKNYTLAGNQFPSRIDIAAARPIVSNFFSRVYLNNRQQDTSMVDYQTSRTFLYSEITAFFNANISNFDSLLQNDTSSLNDYKLLFEIGYTDQSLSQRFYQRVASADPQFGRMYSENELMGFTVTISLIDNKGNLLRNNEINKNNYFRKALEIAHICPPVCGELY